MQASKLGLLVFLLAAGIASSQVYAQSQDAELRSLFRQIDHDRNGYLSRYEYTMYYDKTVAPAINERFGDRGPAALEKIHADNRRRLIEGPLGSGDENQDGRLSFAEYKTYHEGLINL